METEKDGDLWPRREFSLNADLYIKTESLNLTKVLLVFNWRKFNPMFNNKIKIKTFTYRISSLAQVYSVILKSIGS